MNVSWIRNTSGKPDSQLTFLAIWNVLAMALVVLTIVVDLYNGRPTSEVVWAFLAGAIGIKAWSYRGRRRDDHQARAMPTQPVPPHPPELPEQADP